MTKRFLAALVAVAALLTGSLVSTAPASARTVSATEWPATITGYKFWTGSVCMAVGDTTIDALYIAQLWNNVTPGTVMGITASNNCVNAGYTPSTRFTIDTYYANDGTCGSIKNPDGTPAPLERSYYNGIYRYTNNPVVWVNTYGGCWSNASRRAHVVSMMIGAVMGLKVLNSSGYNARVMNQTSWSYDNVPYPETYSGTVLGNLYAGEYGG
jgi:hypothetical protein